MSGIFLSDTAGGQRKENFPRFLITFRRMRRVGLVKREGEGGDLIDRGLNVIKKYENDDKR